MNTTRTYFFFARVSHGEGRSFGREWYLLSREDQMLKQSPTFSTIRTPSSYPASHKRYLRGYRGDLRVPYRQIALSPTRHVDLIEENPPLPVYDTSGPYTDADLRIDLSRGLPDLRTDWIKQRNDTEILAAPSSEYARERERGLLPYYRRFPSPPISRRA